MPLKSLQTALAALLLALASLPTQALFITIGENQQGLPKSIYIDGSTCLFSSGLCPLVQESLQQVAGYLCENPQAQLSFAYTTTLSNCDAADVARDYLSAQGVSDRQISVSEMAAEDNVAEEGFVEIALRPAVPNAGQNVILSSLPSEVN